MVLPALKSISILRGLVVPGLVLATYVVVGWYAHSAGAAGVQAEWDAAVAESTADDLADSVEAGDAALQVVTKYVKEDRIIYRDRDVIVERIVRVCDDAPAREPPELQGDPGPSDGAPAPVTLDALAHEIAECVSTADRLIALQTLVKERCL